MCEGRFDYLERLSDSLLLHIISYLDLKDIASLSQTSQRLSKVTVKSFPSAFSKPFLSFFKKKKYSSGLLFAFIPVFVEYLLYDRHIPGHRSNRDGKRLFFDLKTLTV